VLSHSVLSAFDEISLMHVRCLLQLS
jgi:hypothetical protein